MARRYYRKKKFYRKGGKRTNRVAKMVNGKVPMTQAERLLSAGAPYAKAIPALARSVGYFASMINSEIHFSDTQFVPDTTTTGAITLLTGCSVGDTDSTRTGNKVLGKDLYIRYSAAKNAAASATFLRMIFFVDKELDGALPTISEVLETVNYQSPINQDFGKRFVVMKDMTVNLDNTRTTVASKIYFKLPYHLFYAGTTASVADCKENQVLCLTLSNEATNNPGVSIYSRFKWYDN